MPRLERNTYTNLSRGGAAGLINLLQDENPIEVSQVYDAATQTYTVTVIKPIRDMAPAAG